MNRYFKFIIPLLAVVFSISSASAQLSPRNSRDDDRYNDRRYEDSRYGNNRPGNNWVDIGRTRVSMRDNYERMNVSRRNSNIRQLLFKTDGNVNIYRVVVRYNNGRTEELRLRNNRWNSRSRNSWNDELLVTIPSIGRRSEVREVRFWFDNGNRRPFSSRPTISVYGR